MRCLRRGKKEEDGKREQGNEGKETIKSCIDGKRGGKKRKTRE